MNRRDALKLLAGLPLLGFLKPEAVEADTILSDWAEPKEEGVNLYDGGEIGIMPTGEYTNLVKWNGAGDSTLAIGPDGTLYIGGAFVNPPISNDEYLATWNGRTWIQIEESYPKTSYFRNPTFEDDSLK